MQIDRGYLITECTLLIYFDKPQLTFNYGASYFTGKCSNSDFGRKGENCVTRAFRMSPCWLLVKWSEAIDFKKNFSRAIYVICDCSHKSVSLLWAKHTRMYTLNECNFSKKFCWPLETFSSDAAITQQIFGSPHLDLFLESVFKLRLQQKLNYHLQIRILKEEAIF